MIKALTPIDLAKVKELHEKHYKEEFSWPDFGKNFLGCFTALDQEGRIVSAGGVRTISEAIIITDKSLPAGIRRDALLEMMSASIYVAQHFGYDSIHAFVQEQGWKSHLMKTGFQPIIGDGLIFKL